MLLTQDRRCGHESWKVQQYLNWRPQNGCCYYSPGNDAGAQATGAVALQLLNHGRQVLRLDDALLDVDLHGRRTISSAVAPQ